MAKIFKSLQKGLLERQINKLGYNIRVTKAEEEIYIQKLERVFHKKIEQFSKPYIEKLRQLEIEQLSNEAYILYVSQKTTDKINKKYDLQKRVLKQKEKRQLKKDGVDQESIKKETQKAIDELSEKASSDIKAYHDKQDYRNYTSQTLKENLKQYLSEEKAFNQALDTFKDELTKEHEQLLKDKIINLDQKVEKFEHTLSKKKEILKPLISASNISLEKSSNIDDDTILKIDHLTMQFGGLKAVDDLSFNVKKGEIFGLIGPNGAGKTTVFNCITQFYKPTEGSLIFRNSNNDLVSLTDFKVHNVIKQGIVRTFQNVELIWELSVLDNMLVGAHSLYRSNFFDHSLQLLTYKREEQVLKLRAEKILKNLDLYGYKDFYPAGLPYGVLKKIELARTLMTNPKLIILDEPAAGLNDSETQQLAQTIKKIQKDYDCTIFLVEHDMGLVMNICDTICAISFGKKLAIGTPSEVQQNDFVKEAYLGGE